MPIYSFLCQYTLYIQSFLVSNAFKVDIHALFTLSNYVSDKLLYNTVCQLEYIPCLY